MPVAKVPPETKAKVLADLIRGEQPAVVAERYGIDRILVNQWKRRLPETLVSSVSSPMSSPQVSSIAAYQRQLIELLFLSAIEGFKSDIALAQHIQNVAWLERQTAEGIAELRRSNSTAHLAILELLGRTRKPTDPTTPDPELP